MSKVILDEEGMQRELQWLYDNPEVPVAVDTETTGFRVGGDSYAIGVSLAAVHEGHALSVYIPVRHGVGFNASSRTLSMLQYVLQAQQRRLIFANAQFDILALESIGIKTDHQDFYDVIVMAHFIDENRPMTKSLDSLSKHYLKIADAKVKDSFIEKEKKTGWQNTTYEQMWKYATVDTELTWRLYKRLLTEYETLPTWLHSHKQSLVRVLLQMRRRGIAVNQELATSLVTEAEQAMLGAKQRMGLAPADKVGPKILEQILHVDLNIPVLKTSATTGKPSFNKEAMALYESYIEEAKSPTGAALKEYRGWQKASTASFIPYLRLMDSDGRLRCGYKLHGTATGRLSCAEPNLQQIPKDGKDAWNEQTKSCFVAAPGYTLVNADFSQLELRLGTAYAPDPKLVEVFNDPVRDIFTEMTTQLVDQMPTGWVRHKTKTMVYSMQYGAGKNRIKTVFRVSDEVAQSIINTYKNTYPMFSALNQWCTEKAEDMLEISLWSGRKRHFQYKSEGYKAMNSMIQGGAADIVERVMVRLFQEVDHEEECRMLLQVHDSITFEIRDDLVLDYIPKIKAVMEDVDTVMGVETGVHFAVDVTPWSAIDAAKWPVT